MDHKARIRQELVEAGVTSYGLRKPTIHNLPSVIHPDEHIKGVIYGWRDKNTATIVATDRRLIYMDHKPFFRINDEISYDFVSGISHNAQGRFSGVIIHTRAGDYNLRFVNTECAKIFVNYIESRGIEHLKNRSVGPIKKPGDYEASPSKLVAPDPAKTELQKPISSEVRDFLVGHDIAVLSTINRRGIVNGSVIYYLFGEENYFYIVTKSQTDKALNIIMNPVVALTIFDEPDRKTVQLEGIADLITDKNEIKSVTTKLIKPRVYGGDVAWPPVSLLIAGEFVVIRIKPTSMKFMDYK
jgi:hypothetical protein